MNKLKISTYTDESGQDTRGKMFVVCTVITKSNETQRIEQQLLDIETKSGKHKKWHNTGDKKRHEYIKLLLKGQILTSTVIFYSQYQNKLDYTGLIGSHLAKTILTHIKNREYISKIFIDKVDKKTLLKLTKELRAYHIRYKKIRGVKEESNACIRLADALCGLLRDINNKKIPNNYKTILSKMKEI